MGFSLLEYLDWRIPKKMAVMKEKIFCEENMDYCYGTEFVARYQDVFSAFDLIKKSIIIQSLINKKEIEENAVLYHDADIDLKEKQNIIHDRLPYFRFNDTKIYVPIYNEDINKLYDTKYNELVNSNSSSFVSDFDPFELYGLDIFKSPFTRLIFIKEDTSCGCFFHPELFQIFIINKQGGLDHIIPIMDSFIKRMNFDDFCKVMDSFFEFDRDGFVKGLYEEKFISKEIYNDLLDYMEKKKKKYGE